MGQWRLSWNRSVQWQEAQRAKHSERAGLGTVGPGPTALSRTCIPPRRDTGWYQSPGGPRWYNGGGHCPVVRTAGQHWPGWTCCSWQPWVPSSWTRVGWCRQTVNSSLGSCVRHGESLPPWKQSCFQRSLWGNIQSSLTRCKKLYLATPEGSQCCCCWLAVVVELL